MHWTSGGGRTAARAAVFALAGVALACTPEPESDAESVAGPMDHRSAAIPPRIVLLISIDTLRADHLGVYGYEPFTSPVLDTLAREGTVFEDASATSSWTLPSHASMLTGLHPITHRVLTSRVRLPDDVRTLASILRDAGWETAAAVGVEWLGKESFQLTRGFEKYSRLPSALARRSSSTWVSDQVIDWLDEVADDPLLVFAHYYDVHADYVSEPAYEKLFLTPYEGIVDGTAWQLKRVTMPAEYLRSCHDDFDPKRCTFGESFVVDESMEKLKLSEADVRRLRELYDAQIRQLDAELSRVFAALRRRGLMDETLLIITSDHGEEFMEHGRVDHFLTAYQESIRVPLIIRGPGVPAGRRIQAPVSIIDVLPTILASAGVDTPESVEGLDLTSLWVGGSEEPFTERHLFVEAPGGVASNDFAGDYFPVYRSVRRGSHKLIVEASRGTHALYDLASDPGEQRDIAAREPGLTRELLAIVEARYSTPRPRPEPLIRVELDPEELERLRALGYHP